MLLLSLPQRLVVPMSIKENHKLFPHKGKILKLNMITGERSRETFPYLVSDQEVDLSAEDIFGFHGFTPNASVRLRGGDVEPGQYYEGILRADLSKGVFSFEVVVPAQMNRLLSGVIKTLTFDGEGDLFVKCADGSVYCLSKALLQDKEH